MTVKQLSVFVENQPGRLAEITAVLQRSNVDIRALSIADTTNFGVMRLIVDHPSVAAEQLRLAGFTVSLTKVIAVGVSDKPGGLARALTLLSDGGVVVEYMYAFISREQGTAYVILRPDDTERALTLLTDGGIPVLSEAEVGTDTE
ncbi:MAG: ACT domain-containing protein [Angelakisella sp.]